MIDTNRSVTIIIPNWNGVQLLPECLDGLELLEGVRPRVLIVDDGSIDNSVDMILARYKWVEVIRRGTRGGYASAINTGIKCADSDFIALLNNDAIPDNEWIKNSIHCLERFAGYAVCVPRITYYDAPKIINSVGLYLRWYGKSGDIGLGEPDSTLYNQYAEVFGFTGCAVMFRREALLSVGLFDERLEAYCEDLDWTLRARRQGVRFVYCPDARVRHRGSATFRQFPERAVYLQCRNSLVVVARHVPLRGVVRSSLGLLMFHMYQIIVNMVRGYGFAALRGKFAGIGCILSSIWIGNDSAVEWLAESGPIADPLRSGPAFRVITQ